MRNANWRSWHVRVYDFKWRLPRIIEDSRNKVIWPPHQNDGHSICLHSCCYHSLSIPRTSCLSPYTMHALSSLTVTPRCSSFHLPIYMQMQYCYVCVLNTLWSFRLTIDTSGMAYNPWYVNSCLASPIRLISYCCCLSNWIPISSWIFSKKF